MDGMALDARSLDSGTPKAKDGRSYPRHLKRYEAFDTAFLPIFEATARPVAFDDLIEMVDDRQARAAASRWIDSASWRGLIQPIQRRGRRPRAWKAGPRLKPPQAA
jgi:hypothetical protein